MIENLNLKLSGKLPITREELLEIVNSWGRIDNFDTNDNIYVNRCNPAECYPLENLNVSEITDLSYIFRDSPYDGDLSKWNVSSCENMDRMFSWSKFNNHSISNWNISKCEDFEFTFANAIFDGDISKWQFKQKNISCEDMFYNNISFKNKYNEGYIIPEDTKDFLQWFEENRLHISNSNISKEEISDFDNYLNNFEIKKELNNGN